MMFAGEARCDSCGSQQPATTLIDFGDSGLVFYVCDGCAVVAKDRGCNVLPVDRLTDWWATQ